MKLSVELGVSVFDSNSYIVGMVHEFCIDGGTV